MEPRCCVVITSPIRWGKLRECGTVVISSILCSYLILVLSHFLLVCFQELFWMRRMSLSGLSQVVYAWPTLLCFGVCHSPDVVVCNLCHVLVGSMGVVHLPLHLWFTRGFWVLFRALMLDSKESLKRRAGFGMSFQGQSRKTGMWWKNKAQRNGRMEETDSKLHGVSVSELKGFWSDNK